MMRKLGSLTSVILVSYFFGLILARFTLPRNHNDAVEEDQLHSLSDSVDTAISPLVAENEQDTPAQGLPVHSAANAFASGDGKLLAGDPGGALRRYESLLAQVPNGVSDPLRYRIALCAESLGKLDRAMNEYKRLASRAAGGRIGVAAQLGQARIWSESNRAVLARRVMWNLLLRDRSNGAISPDLRAECVHRLAQLLAHQTIDPTSNDFASDSVIVDAPLRWSMREALLWIMNDADESQTLEPEKGEAKEPEEAAVRLTQQLGRKAEETYLTASLPKMPVAVVIELLADKAHLELDWSAAARDRVSEHTVQLAVQETTLGIILDGISDSMELVWSGSADRIRLQTRSEADADFLRIFDFAVAERMLRRATTAFPDHELTDEAYSALGNIGVRRGQLEFACLQYEQFLRQFPQSDVRVGVYFNAAKAKLRLGERDEAMKYFYHVVDEGVGDLLQVAAFLYLGRLYLEDDQAKQAIRPLTRAVSQDPDGPLRATSAITLASAYLLVSNPHAANRVLMTHRSAFAEGPHYDQTAFLAALARHQAAISATRTAKEGQSLLAALSHVEGTDFFGAQGFVLLAEAYKRLGLIEPMYSTLIRGLEVDALGEVRARMLYELAEYHRGAGDLRTCTEILASLAIDGDGKWADRAKLRLADVMYAAGDDDQCLSMCHNLLETTDQSVDEQDVLKIMGRVLERQGNHREAAMCFAGIVPGSSTVSQQGAMR